MFLIKPMFCINFSIKIDNVFCKIDVNATALSLVLAIISLCLDLPISA